jgi:hypothetical protein
MATRWGGRFLVNEIVGVGRSRQRIQFELTVPPIIDSTSHPVTDR